ncbi:MAG: hypothetical protein RBT63_01950 [Bdellovibrionales bacterium]|jgi:uncharacterized membrane protein YgcG|nr:hypothetical protein [Bdellovibrionales bacterium]
MSFISKMTMAVVAVCAAVSVSMVSSQAMGQSAFMFSQTAIESMVRDAIQKKCETYEDCDDENGGRGGGGPDDRHDDGSGSRGGGGGGRGYDDGGGDRGGDGGPAF